MLIDLENQTWYQIHAEIHAFSQMIKYANYLIIILMKTLEMRENRGKN